MLYLSEATTRKVIDVDKVLEIIELVARAQAGGRIETSNPQTSVLITQEPRTRYRVKTCALPDIPVVGIRIIGYPLDKADGQTSTRFVLLSDPRSGAPLALIDDHWTYTLRTAASAVVGLRHLTREQPLSVGMVGAGNLAYAMTLILSHIGRLGTMRVTSRRAESREAFARRLEEELRVEATVCESVSEAVGGADLVVTSTDANRRLVGPEGVRRGATICTLGRYELAPEIYARADKIVVDSWEVARSVPDIKDLLEQKAIAPERIHAELHQLVSGARPGRENDGETIVFRTDGIVAQDVAIAYVVYEAAVANGLGTRLA